MSGTQWCKATAKRLKQEGKKPVKVAAVSDLSTSGYSSSSESSSEDSSSSSEESSSEESSSEESSSEESSSSESSSEEEKKTKAKPQKGKTGPTDSNKVVKGVVAQAKLSPPAKPAPSRVKEVPKPAAKPQTPQRSVPAATGKQGENGKQNGTPVHKKFNGTDENQSGWDQRPNSVGKGRRPDRLENVSYIIQPALVPPAPKQVVLKPIRDYGSFPSLKQGEAPRVGDLLAFDILELTDRTPEVVFKVGSSIR